MQWACLYLPHLALDGVLRHRRDSNPLVIVGGNGAERRLLDVNTAAHRQGLRPGQALTTAHALLADFEIITHDPQADAGWLRFLAAWAYRYSGHVVLLDDAVVLEVGHSLRLFGPWLRLEARLRDELSELGFRHALAAAPTARGARILAGAQDGLAVTGKGELEKALANVPLERAGLPGSAGERLAGMGVRTLGQVLALPRAGLVRRFGRSLAQWLDALLDEPPGSLPPYRPPDHFEQRLEFDQGVDNHQALAFPLRRLIGDLAACLAGRDCGVQRFRLLLEHEHCRATVVAVGLRAAEREAGVLFELAREYLARHTLPEATMAMRLVARDLPAFVPASADLFERTASEGMPLPRLCDRLRARLGEQAVYRLAPVVDHRPERAQALRPAVEDKPRASTAREGLPAGSEHPVLKQRPTWLLQRPIPLRGPPPRIVSGPERLETGWWDGGDIRRDYYVVETQQGQRAWVFCPPGEPGQWMLHGWFA